MLALLAAGVVKQAAKKALPSLIDDAFAAAVKGQCGNVDDYLKLAFASARKEVNDERIFKSASMQATQLLKSVEQRVPAVTKSVIEAKSASNLARVATAANPFSAMFDALATGLVNMVKPAILQDPFVSTFASFAVNALLKNKAGQEKAAQGIVSLAKQAITSYASQTQLGQAVQQISTVAQSAQAVVPQLAALGITNTRAAAMSQASLTPTVAAVRGLASVPVVKVSPAVSAVPGISTRAGTSPFVAPSLSPAMSLNKSFADPNIQAYPQLINAFQTADAIQPFAGNKAFQATEAIDTFAANKAFQAPATTVESMNKGFVQPEMASLASNKSFVAPQQMEVQHLGTTQASTLASPSEVNRSFQEPVIEAVPRLVSGFQAPELAAATSLNRGFTAPELAAVPEAVGYVSPQLAALPATRGYVAPQLMTPVQLKSSFSEPALASLPQLNRTFQEPVLMKAISIGRVMPAAGPTAVPSIATYDLATRLVWPTGPTRQVSQMGFAETAITSPSEPSTTSQGTEANVPEKEITIVQYVNESILSGMPHEFNYKGSTRKSTFVGKNTQVTPRAHPGGTLVLTADMKQYYIEDMSVDIMLRMRTPDVADSLPMTIIAA